MSRIGRLPVTIPAGVDVKLEGSHVEVKGPKGQLAHTFPAVVKISVDAGILHVARESDLPRNRAMHGMTRALLNNMITGVSSGYQKVLQIEGVGYRAEMDGKNLLLYVGYSQPKPVVPPEGISFEVENRVKITVKGYDKQLVGQVAANIREIRPPEPYKGKGIRYASEVVRRKAGKSGKK
ncbi:MAG: 50S ribosomal protein L6 [Anaerolineales bacterium]|nr:50S ribosomal protein L6 [Anaerolineales bacterium]